MVFFSVVKLLGYVFIIIMLPLYVLKQLSIYKSNMYKDFETVPSETEALQKIKAEIFL